jgi:4-amino-4-deoxy-L-arabinose transferase-like glycosyltransferase
MTRIINPLLGLLLAILLLRLGLAAVLPLADTTEPRYAEIARLMAISGDWITPWYEPGVPFWGKPPLSFWAQALSFRWLGVSELAGRLPSWLATLAIVYLVYRTRRALHPRPHTPQARDAGLWAALIFATTTLGFMSAGTVMTDSFLALGTTLALASLVLRLQGAAPVWGVLFFLGLAIGLLAKGPLTLVLTGLPIGVWVLSTGQWRRLWQCLPWRSGSLLTLALVLPWYLLAEWKTPGFLDYFIVGEHFKRFLVSNWQGDRYGNAHDFARGTIWLFLLLASLPWGPVALARWRHRPDPDTWQPAAAGIGRLVVAAALTPALFFTLAGNILWTYVLPGLPFLAVLATQRPPRRARSRRVALAGALLIPMLGVAAGGWFAWHPDRLTTEKGLIQRLEQRPGADLAQLTYIKAAPYSARFYSRGQVRTMDRQTLTRRLDAGDLTGLSLVAVSNRDHALLARLSELTPPLDRNSRYTLFRLPRSNGDATRPARAGRMHYNASEPPLAAGTPPTRTEPTDRPSHANTAG